jgi:hypothetical protein
MAAGAVNLKSLTVSAAIISEVPHIKTAPERDMRQLTLSRRFAADAPYDRERADPIYQFGAGGGRLPSGVPDAKLSGPSFTAASR